LIGEAIPSDRNVIQKEAENRPKLKYKNLSIQIQRMWYMKCFVIPVIIRAPGTVSKGLKNSGNGTRTTFNRFCTKTAILGTSHIIRRYYNLRRLKPEWWGTPLLKRRSTRENKTCDKRTK
jgi:hypothetical protein